ncbi:FAD-dependent oxidoreductase [Nocardia sp. NPDC004568]|uniref:FAD-dependent oxidoreductase n=1 Tax=Nocardia sp. NPDC004568 TaxID=3154551 RepID=UPI0033AB6195
MSDPLPKKSATIDRRTALRGAFAGAAILAAGSAATGPARAAAPRRRTPGLRTGGKEVAVFGGGMAGLSAAHELAERGFQVTVYEPAFLGGKARSMPVPGTGAVRTSGPARRARFPLLPRLLPEHSRHHAAYPLPR